MKQVSLLALLLISTQAFADDTHVLRPSEPSSRTLDVTEEQTVKNERKKTDAGVAPRGGSKTLELRNEHLSLVIQFVQELGAEKKLRRQYQQCTSTKSSDSSKQKKVEAPAVKELLPRGASFSEGTMSPGGGVTFPKLVAKTRRLRSPWRSFLCRSDALIAVLLPAKALKPKQTWTVDPKLLNPLLPSWRRTADVKGKVQGTLESVKREGGCRVARVTVSIRLEADQDRLPKHKSFRGLNRLEGKAEVLVDLDSHVVLSLEIETKSEVLRDVWDSGRKVSTTTFALVRRAVLKKK